MRSSNEPGGIDPMDEAIARAKSPKAVLFVNAMLKEAIQRRATRIRLIRGTERASLHMLVDGSWSAQPVPDASSLPGVISRLLVLAGLDPCSDEAQQDGSFLLTIQERALTFKLSRRRGGEDEELSVSM